ncbi:unnamed protein product [Urochloa humidicola]
MQSGGHHRHVIVRIRVKSKDRFVRKRKELQASRAGTNERTHPRTHRRVAVDPRFTGHSLLCASRRAPWSLKAQLLGGKGSAFRDAETTDLLLDAIAARRL